MDVFPKRILIVEDDPAHAEALRRSLQAACAAVEVRVVGTLQEYRLAVAADVPDIALLDLNLPDGRAVDVLTLPLETGAFPVLVMTSYGNEQTAVEALKSGAIDYVVKSPEAFATMPRAVERALREWELLRKHKLDQDEICRHHALIEAIIKSPAEIIVCALDRDYRYLLFNPPHARLMRTLFDVDIREGHPFLDYITIPEVRELFRTDLDHALAGNGFRDSRHLPSLDLHLEISVSPIMTSAAEIVGVTMFASDISASVRAKTELARKSEELALTLAELKDAHARVIQQEKMASIGQLAAGVAHEINNPMGYITSNMNTLRKYVERLTRLIELQEAVIASGANEASRKELEEIRSRGKINYVIKDFQALITESLEGAERVRKIVQDLKSFSRAETIEPIPSDINECIRTTANIVHNEIKYVATLAMDLNEVPPVVCMPQQISQVLMNLLVNAAHAIEKQGVITISTSHDNHWVSIKVSDTGKGIPKEILEKIFEPFFTTKEVGKGTGLGLAISLDIINRHGGEISVESEVGVGTSFIIRLPLDRTSGLEGTIGKISR